MMSKETFIEPHKSRELEPMIILEGSMAADMQALCWRKSREYTSLSLRQKRANCNWQGVETSKSTPSNMPPPTRPHPNPSQIVPPS